MSSALERAGLGVSDDVRTATVVVDEGTRATGGTNTQLLAGTALAGKLQQLADVLTHTYRVVYAHPDSLIPPEAHHGRRPAHRTSKSIRHAGQRSAGEDG